MASCTAYAFPINVFAMDIIKISGTGLMATDAQGLPIPGSSHQIAQFLEIQPAGADMTVGALKSVLLRGHFMVQGKISLGRGGGLGRRCPFPKAPWI
jgi:hypothetical protein